VTFSLASVVARIDVAKTWTEKQTMTGDATDAPFSLTPVAGDPSGRVNGDIWLNVTSQQLFCRINGVDVDLGAGAGGGEANLIASLGGGTVLTAGVPKSGITLQTVSIATTAPIAHAVATDLLTISLNALVDADISGSADIAKSKIALAGTWANAEIANLPVLGTLPASPRQVAITNAELAGSIAYAKLILTGEILNADLAGSIAKTKILVAGTWSNAEIANLPVLGTLPSPPRQVAITNAELNNLPVLGTLPASPRQLAIVDSEISTVGLSKILGDVALGDIIKRGATDWARLARGANGQFFRSNATDSLFEAIIFSKGGTVLDPDVRNIITWRAPFACTVTNVRGYRVGGTTASINARKNGTLNHLASDNVIGTADTWDDGGAVQNTAYAIGDKLEIMITVVTGSPTQVAVQVDFTRP